MTTKYSAPETGANTSQNISAKSTKPSKRLVAMFAAGLLVVAVASLSPPWALPTPLPMRLHACVLLR